MKANNSHIGTYNKFILIIILLFVSTFFSCKKFFDVDIDKSLVSTELVFTDNQNATSALAGIYRTMAEGPFLGGGADGVSSFSGMSADEFNNILQTEEYAEFEKNELNADNLKILNLWKSAYSIIYQCNLVVEKLKASGKVDLVVKNQILGEVYFIRAITYFYLVNLFNDVPLIINTDYKTNSTARRTAKSDVYSQMLSDLNSAHGLLTEKYPMAERIRPNKFAASAMLARVSLYLGKWDDASRFSTEVINNTNYQLSTNLSSVFKRGSKETIFEISSDEGFNTREGNGFIIQWGAGSETVKISDNLITSFASNDLRKNAWIGEYVENSIVYRFPWKYQRTLYDTPLDENFIVLRLAELFLIRSEANVKLENLEASADDLDKVRIRAGLSPIRSVVINLSSQMLLTEIESERRHELFSEWGHRWLDLKRWDKATQVLSPLKGASWQTTDIFYPLPQDELISNPFLKPQNSGY